MMFSRISDKSKVSKILLISLSNIGDVVLTLPVADILRRDFPHAQISLVVGPKAQSLFHEPDVFAEVIILNKHQPKSELWKWVKSLRKRQFDLVVDLRNSMIPFMLWPRFMTPPEMKRKKGIHMRQKHLNRLRTVYPFNNEQAGGICLKASASDSNAVRDMLGTLNHYVVMSPGSADQAKRWSVAGFATVAKYLKKEYDLDILFLGDQSDQTISQRIRHQLDFDTVDLCGKTSLSQSAEIVRTAQLAIVNDSGVMHLASYHNIPTIGLFGYTDPVKYGPWSDQCAVIQPLSTLPAESTTEQRVSYIESIAPERVIEKISFVDGMVKVQS